MVTLGRRIGILCAALFVFAAGCDRPLAAAELQTKFDQAEKLLLDQRYDEAKQAFKQYLLQDPKHPGAHYYLAQTYIASLDARQSGLAENESQLALRLFHEQDRKSGINRYDPKYFEMMCEISSAKALYIQAGVLSQDATLTSIALDSLRRAADYIERARAINPNAAEINDVGIPIRELAAKLRGDRT
jgi:tetratricopeptide (TPR) repeat protein